MFWSELMLLPGFMLPRFVLPGFVFPRFALPKLAFVPGFDGKGGGLDLCEDE